MRRNRPGGWGESAEYGQLLAQLRSLFFGQSDKGLSCTLGVADKSNLFETRLCDDPRRQRGKIENTHLSNIPAPHPRVVVLKQCMLGLEPTTVVAKPHVIARLAQPESERVVIITAISTRAL
jgi:hypothetical protein